MFMNGLKDNLIGLGMLILPNFYKMRLTPIYLSILELGHMCVRNGVTEGFQHGLDKSQV
uniref:Uncharacterized protein n=1 Tax=Lotus japonicus TaxID=34305 RepID=I3SVQ9_LOTJA|nr:unknown [Lotus japonicus]